MVDGTPFRGMFLGDHTHRVALEVRKGRIIKRSHYPPKINLLSKICRDNLGVLGHQNEIAGYLGFLRPSIADRCAIA